MWNSEEITITTIRSKAKRSDCLIHRLLFQICSGLNANEIQIPYGKHQVLIKRYLTYTYVQSWT